MSPTIETYEIFILIKQAWKQSFHRFDKNEYVIISRGWLTYNRNIITYKDIKATKNSNKCPNEIGYDVFVRPPYNAPDIYDITTDNPPTYNNQMF